MHVFGTLTCLSDADAERIVAALVERFEGVGPDAWRFAMKGRAREAMIENIQAFRLRIERITGKFKLSQNRSANDRRRVIAELDRAEAPESRATAAWMQRFADPDDA